MKKGASYRYLIPVAERQPEALYAFKSSGFGGEIGVVALPLYNPRLPI